MADIDYSKNLCFEFSFFCDSKFDASVKDI